MPGEGNSALQGLKQSQRISLVLGVLVYAAAYGILYYTYVPRVLRLQLALLPLVLVTVVLSANSVRKGMLLVVFLIPLVGGLPYFFGLSGFNPLFFIFYGWVMGLLVHQAVHPVRLRLKNPLFWPVAGASLVVVVSGIVTFWRYTNFFPLHGGAVYDLAVNILNVSAGEALRKVLFDGLNYFGGFIWFFVAVNVMRAGRTVRAAMSLLAGASLVSFGFGIYQSVENPGLGNQDWFIQAGRINALFSDPNALGVFLVLCVPVWAGVLMIGKRGGKALFAGAILAGIYLIPDSGSRVGMLGLAVGLGVLVFLLVRLGIYARKRDPGVWRTVLAHSAVAMVVLGLVSVFVLIDRDSNLNYRISENIKSLKVLFNPRAREIILHGRHLTWPSSVRMVRDYPVSGVGVGAYTSELPNFYEKYDITPVKSSFYYREFPGPDIRVDSAGNLFLHVAAEMGLIGAVFLGWVFVLLAGRIWRDNFRRREVSARSFLRIGISSSLVAVFVIFLLGAHTLHFEILLVFWMLVGTVYARPEHDEGKKPEGEIPQEENSAGFSSVGSTGRDRVSGIGIGLLVVVFGFFLVWDSFSRLSLRERTERFHLHQEFGLYQKEMVGRWPFRWTGKTAGMTVKANKPVMVVPVLASHPDIGERPVGVRVYLTGDFFRTRSVLDDFVLRGHGWRERQYDFSGRIGAEAMVVFEVSRLWRPGEELGSADSRSLGIALGEVRFEAPETGEVDVDVEEKAEAEAEVRAEKEGKEEGEEKERRDKGLQWWHEPDKMGRLGKRVYRFEPEEGEGEMGGKPPHIMEVGFDVSLGEGDYLIRLRAGGREAGEKRPLAGIRVDGRLTGEDWIEPDVLDDYYTRVRLKEGRHTVRVVFMNEAYVAQTREYRMLYVDSVEIYRK